MRISSRTFALLALLLLGPASAAQARLAVVTTGKSKVAIVDLGRKKVVARPDVGLPTRAVGAVRRRSARLRRLERPVAPAG